MLIKEVFNFGFDDITNYMLNIDNSQLLRNLQFKSVYYRYMDNPHVLHKFGYKKDLSTNTPHFIKYDRH